MGMEAFTLISVLTLSLLYRRAFVQKGKAR